MKADLTRNTLHPLKHFTRVLMQQGRVQLDADWNEQAAILLRYLRALAADVIGPQGGPKDAAGNVGFAIASAQLQTGQPVNQVADDFLIGAGHYYVAGILCEVDSAPVPITNFPNDNNKNQVQVLIWPLDDLAFQKDHYVEVFDDEDPPAAPAVQAKITDLDPASRTLTFDTDVSSFNKKEVKQPRVRPLTTYLTQPDYPVPRAEMLAAGKSYLVYLDVWERLITYVEDDSIREIALGGPDTATRAKLVWQVKTIAGTPGRKTPCDGFVPDGDSSFVPIVFGFNHGLLRAMAKQDATATDPCITPPDARYRGPENQLYRVEIHRGGTAWNGKDDPPDDAAATFKWSRENGSVVFPIAGGGGTNTLTLETLGRDDRFGLAEGDWVEVQDDDYVLQNRAGNLLQVQSIDRTSMTVTLSSTPDLSVGKDMRKHPLLRRWDQKEGDPTENGLQLDKSDHAALVVEDGNWLDLEDGVQIQFQPPDLKQPAAFYRTGDYWLIPARTATGDVEWPSEIQKDGEGNPERVPIAKPPDGVTHHYAPLAVITVDGNGIHLVTPSCQRGYDTIAKQLP